MKDCEIIDSCHIEAIGVFLETKKNVQRYKRRLHDFRKKGTLGKWSMLNLLTEMDYTVILKKGSVEIIEPTNEASV